MADDDNHLSHVLSITKNAITRNMPLIWSDQNQNADHYLKEKDVQNQEDVNEELKIENELLKRKIKHVMKMFEMSDMKIKLTDISKKEDENQKLKDKIKSLESKLKIHRGGGVRPRTPGGPVSPLGHRDRPQGEPVGYK